MALLSLVVWFLREPVTDRDNRQQLAAKKPTPNWQTAKKVSY